MECERAEEPTVGLEKEIRPRTLSLIRKEGATSRALTPTRSQAPTPPRS
jgi:hypothetical protein